MMRSAPDEEVSLQTGNSAEGHTLEEGRGGGAVR